MDFGENLKKIREEKNLSQQKLAKKLNVAQSTIGMWESSQRTPRLSELNRLARVLNITVNRLLGQPKDQKVEIVKNELYIDGDKVSDLDEAEVKKVIEYIEVIKKNKGNLLPATPLKINSPPKKVLIIDDEQELCEMLYSFLIPHNYKVFLAFNGQMGLEYFEEIKPDIVLLDLKMPDIDGLEVLKIIRKISNVPVVIITGHPEDVSDIHLADLKIEGYIEKPINLKTVLNTLKYLVDK